MTPWVSVIMDEDLDANLPVNFSVRPAMDPDRTPYFYSVGIGQLISPISVTEIQSQYCVLASELGGEEEYSKGCPSRTM